MSRIGSMGFLFNLVMIICNLLYLLNRKLGCLVRFTSNQPPPAAAAACGRGILWATTSPPCNAPQLRCPAVHGDVPRPPGDGAGHGICSVEISHGNHDIIIISVCKNVVLYIINKFHCHRPRLHHKVTEAAASLFRWWSLTSASLCNS